VTTGQIPVTTLQTVATTGQTPLLTTSAGQTIGSSSNQISSSTGNADITGGQAVVATSANNISISCDFTITHSMSQYLVLKLEQVSFLALSWWDCLHSSSS
jgi:hypothetical protein